MGEDIVAGLFLTVAAVYFLVNPGHAIPQLHQLEVEMGTEETGLGFADNTLGA